MEKWVKISKEGKLGEVGKNRRPLTEIELELAKVKHELTITRMERDLLKNYRATALSPVRVETCLI